MSDESNGVEAKTEDQVEDNEEESMSKCKKIKISKDETEQADTNQNEDTKSEVSGTLKDTPESTNSTVNSRDSSTNITDLVASNVDTSTSNSDSVVSNIDSSSNHSDLVVSNLDSSTNNSDNASNESEQVESASSNIFSSAKNEPECTDSNSDVPKQGFDDNTEAEQSESVIQDNNQENKSDPAIVRVQNESSETSTDLVSDNENRVTKQAVSDDKNDKNKISENTLKNDQESLYELLNNPMDVQDDSSISDNGKTKDSAASNGSSEQMDSVAVQDETASTEIQKNDEISCQELLDILQEKDKKIKKKVLIIDVRNDEEYCKSRMSFHDNLINIPEEKIQANKVPGYYRYILLYDIEAEKKFSRRSHNDIIVLVDKNSELKTMASDSKIAIFKNSLEEFDVHIDYKRIAILKGGFEEWSKLHPDFVTKS